MHRAKYSRALGKSLIVITYDFLFYNALIFTFHVFPDIIKLLNPSQMP